MTYQFIKFKEDSFVVKNMRSETEKEEAYRLRYDIFCKELRWVSAGDDHREIDGYDSHAMFLGVFTREDELLGLVRIIPSYMPMMIEREFSELISTSYKLRKEKDTIEVTRLAVKKSIRNIYGRKVAMALFKGVYLWNLMNNVRYSYIVVEKKKFKQLKAIGFPCRRIGPITPLEGKVESLAAIIDWKEFEEKQTVCSYFLQPDDFQFDSLCDSMTAGRRI